MRSISRGEISRGVTPKIIHPLMDGLRRPHKKWHLNVSPPTPTMSNENKAPTASERRRKRRWGDAPVSTTTPSSNSSNNNNNNNNRTPPVNSVLALKQSVAARLAAVKAAKEKAAAGSSNGSKPSTTLSSTEALKQSVAARLAAVKAAKAAAASSSSTQPPPLKKAKHYELDLSITTPLAKTQPSKPVKKINPYLSHLEPSDQQSTSTEEDASLIDNRLAGGAMGKDSQRTQRKEFKFVEPGSYIHKAERRRQKVHNAQQSGFMSGRKQGMFVKATGMGREEEEEPEGGDESYYGQSKEDQEKITLVDSSKVPRADCPVESVRGSTKESGGVVVIPMPHVMEWWDLELLPKTLKQTVIQKEGESIKASAKKRLKLLQKQNVSKEGDDEEKQDGGTPAEMTKQDIAEHEEWTALYQQCQSDASLKHAKTHGYIQHIVPIIPPNSKQTTPTPTLYLTKKEQKRQRKLRRQEKLREQQDLQAAGVIPAPEPRLTLSNFMRVMGEKAVLDPSQMEKKVMEQIHARRLKHEEHNRNNQLTQEERRAKKARKLAEDTSEKVSVALFWVKDMSHPYHRTKVDLNAQQNNITGGVLECGRPKLSLVICEGGPKAIKRYIRLMTVRMDWKGERVGDDDQSDEEEDDVNMTDDNNGEQPKAQKFNAENSCELVWTGMSVKRMFNSFVFQSCTNSEKARQVLEAKGVAHFWDQVLVHANGSGENFKFNLVE